jgi:acyl-CoA synthetase (AMP-forming)/AMP-acid ligase II
MNPMSGRMMQVPLLISSLIRHAARHSGDTEIVSRRFGGDIHRTTYRAAELRSRKLAQALARLGCEAADRIGTLAWNGYRHFEIYYGVSGSQRVCHTINPCLFPDQIAWIANDAADRVLCFDLTFLPLVEQIAPALEQVRHFVLMTDRAHMPAETSLPDLLCYEDLIDAEDGDYRWPIFDENAASSLCCKSGTTGHALYSHRSSLLHACGAALPDARWAVPPAMSSCRWCLCSTPTPGGLPYSAPMVGAKLVFPGPILDGKSLHELFEQEQVTFSAGVPTVWLGVINHLKCAGLKMSSLRRTMIGGAACPPAMRQTLEQDYGVEVSHAWGMTELSPPGTLSRLRAKHAQLPDDAKQALRNKQGRAICGIDLAIVGDDGQQQPRDGCSSGDLLVRGARVIERYFGETGAALRELDGEMWFATGDVATIDADGFMQITDRSKDVIKSGGEWISSIELENISLAHPAVLEAAVIACRHPKWDERPLLVVVRKPRAEPDRDAMPAFHDGKVARWQVRDEVVFVGDIPHTATGKMLKLRLRQQFGNHVLP